MKKVVKIGTRGSLLAVAQTKLVQYRLLQQGIKSEQVIIKTSGDCIQDKSLADIGGKALFTKEIERALLQGHIDMAVHSMKDVETKRPHGLVIPAVLPREDPRDAFLSPSYDSLQDIPPGVRIGTCAPRRAAQVLALQPKAEITLFRGNVHTRLKKLARGEVDATFLALAGLKRVGLESHAQEILDPKVMLPAAGQGVIGVECLETEKEIYHLLERISHQETARCVALERCYLAFLEGDCHTPVGALAVQEKENQYYMQTFVGKEDGSQLLKKNIRGSFQTVLEQAKNLGREAQKWLATR